MFLMLLRCNDEMFLCLGTVVWPPDDVGMRSIDARHFLSKPCSYSELICLYFKMNNNSDRSIDLREMIASIIIFSFYFRARFLGFHSYRCHSIDSRRRISFELWTHGWTGGKEEKQRWCWSLINFLHGNEVSPIVERGSISFCFLIVRDVLDAVKLSVPSVLCQSCWCKDARMIHLSNQMYPSLSFCSDGHNCSVHFIRQMGFDYTIVIIDLASFSRKIISIKPGEILSDVRRSDIRYDNFDLLDAELFAQANPSSSNDDRSLTRKKEHFFQDRIETDVWFWTGILHFRLVAFFFYLFSLNGRTNSMLSSLETAAPWYFLRFHLITNACLFVDLVDCCSTSWRQTFDSWEDVCWRVSANTEDSNVISRGQRTDERFPWLAERWQC